MVQSQSVLGKRRPVLASEMLTGSIGWRDLLISCKKQVEQDWGRRIGVWYRCAAWFETRPGFAGRLLGEALVLASLDRGRADRAIRAIAVPCARCFHAEGVRC